MKILKLFLVPALLSLTGCDMWQDYPMRNPQSGEYVTCMTWRELWGLTGPERRMLDACIHACEAQGFAAEKENGADGDKPRRTVMVNRETDIPDCTSKGS